MKKILGQKRKFEEKTQLDSVTRNEYFSQFDKRNNGIDIPYLDIKEIKTVHYLLDYLKLNPDIKTLTAHVPNQLDEAVCLLASNNTLTDLNLYGPFSNSSVSINQRVDQGFFALASNQSLTKLHISAGSFSLEGITQLLKNTVLKILELESRYQKYNEIACILSTHPSLEELKLDSTVIPGDCYHLLNSHFKTLGFAQSPGLGYEGVKVLSRHPSLTSLDLSGCKITNEAAPLFLELKTLKVLKLNFSKIDDQGIGFISQHPNINDFTVGGDSDGPYITSRGIELFLKMKKEVLKCFAFYGLLKDYGMGDYLARILSDCTALTYLTLLNCEIGPKGAALISKSESLEDINLSGNPVGDEGACYLSTSPRLKSLYLHNCGIGDKGATALAGNQGINRLILSGNAKIGLLGLIALAFNRTITQIIFDYKEIPEYDLAWLFLAGNQTMSYAKYGRWIREYYRHQPRDRSVLVEPVWPDVRRRDLQATRRAHARLSAVALAFG